jgi:hypothetical protein
MYRSEFEAKTVSREPLSHRPAEMSQGEKRSVETRASAPTEFRRSLLSNPSDAAARLLSMQRIFGNRYVQRFIQAQLEVSQPGDPHEREADLVAERMVNTPAEGAQPVAQRVPASADEIAEQPPRKEISPQTVPWSLTRLSAVVDREGKETGHEQPVTGAEREAPNGVLPHAEEAVSAASNSTGQSLPPGLQHKFEQALGVDLSAVRVHTGSRSTVANRAISARAYTVGNDIHFNQGQYDPGSSGGQRLLAHEVVHTVQQGSSHGVQGKLIQTDGQDPQTPPLPASNTPGAPATTTTPGAPATTTTPGAPATTVNTPGAPAGQATIPGAPATTVNTLWNINFNDQFTDTGAKVEGRRPTTSLYVNQLKVAPEGDQGKEAPLPKLFAGVTLAKTGSAQMGSYAHPKDKGGKVSSSVAYGAQPTFDFTIKTVDYDPKTASKGEKDEAAKAKAMNSGAGHRAVVKELTDALGTFVEETEAQAVLTNIVNAKFQNVGVEATIKMTNAKTTKPINTTDLQYGALSSDKTFNLMVTIPNATKDKTSSYTTNRGGEITQGIEGSSTRAVEKGTSAKSTIETAWARSYETAFTAELNAAAENVKKNANLNERTTTHTGTMKFDNSTSADLDGDIHGEAGLDLSGIPLAGKVLGKLLNAKVNIELHPKLSDTFTLEHISTDEDAKKTVLSEESTVRNALSTTMMSSVKSKWDQSLKQSVETATHEVTTETTGAKATAGAKVNESTAATTTTGTITIVANAVQPVLTEEVAKAPK